LVRQNGAAAPTQLVAALEQRLSVLSEAITATHEKMRRHQEAMRALHSEIEHYVGEADDLKRVLSRYDAESTTLFPAAPPQNGAALLGPSDMLVRLTAIHPEQRIGLSALIDAFTAEVQGEHVRTDTTDPRKLASSVIAQLVRNGRLHRDGDEITLGSGMLMES
jgi:hypothetical protein